MKNDPVRRGLVLGLAASLLLPMVLVVTLGTGALLAAVGDAAAAAICRWCSVPLGILWGVSIAVTTALSAVSLLAEPPRGGPSKGRRARPPRDRG